MGEEAGIDNQKIATLTEEDRGVDALDDMSWLTGMARRRMRESLRVEVEGEAAPWTVSISASPRSRPIRLKSDLGPTTSDAETWRIPFSVDALFPMRAFKSIIDVDDG